MVEVDTKRDRLRYQQNVWVPPNVPVELKYKRWIAEWTVKYY